jgi:hypothetical protein
MVPAIFEDQGRRKEGGLRINKPFSQEVGEKMDFCGKRLRRLNSNK